MDSVFELEVSKKKVSQMFSKINHALVFLSLFLLRWFGLYRDVATDLVADDD